MAQDAAPAEEESAELLSAFDHVEAFRPLTDAPAAALPGLTLPAWPEVGPPRIAKDAGAALGAGGRAAPPVVARAPREAAPPKPATNAPQAVKRLHAWGEEDLRRHLLPAPELSVDALPATFAKLLRAGQLAAPTGKYTTPSELLERADLQGLPYVHGETCRLGKEPAENLQSLSVKLRAFLARAAVIAQLAPVPDARPDARELRRLLLEDAEKRHWLVSEAVPTLQQLLMAENKALRLVLVDALAQIPGSAASRGLAQRAVFDLNPEVRQAAVEALRARPREEFQDFLLISLGYPWAPASVHAAEAVVALDLRGLAPAIRDELERGDPALPYAKPGSRTMYVRDVVRVNHGQNCLLCHAPSFQAADPVRAAVPPRQRAAGSYVATGPTFIRADVTFLRQDFSVFQPVPRSAPGRENQRFDYVVRERVATTAERNAKYIPSSQLGAALYAYRQLTDRREDSGGAVAQARRD